MEIVNEGYSGEQTWGEIWGLVAGDVVEVLDCMDGIKCEKGCSMIRKGPLMIIEEVDCSSRTIGSVKGWDEYVSWFKDRGLTSCEALNYARHEIFGHIGNTARGIGYVAGVIGGVETVGSNGESLSSDRFIRARGVPVDVSTFEEKYLFLAGPDEDMSFGDMLGVNIQRILIKSEVESICGIPFSNWSSSEMCCGQLRRLRDVIEEL